MLIKTAFLDWDSTLAEAGTTNILAGANEFVNSLFFAGIDVYILTSRPGRDPSQAIFDSIQQNKLNFPREKVLWVGAQEYQGHANVANAKVAAIIQKTEANQNVIDRTCVGFMDDQPDNINEARRQGFQTLQVPSEVEMMPVQAKHFYETTAAPFFILPTAQYWLADANHKINQFREYRVEVNSTSYEEIAKTTYFLYKQAEASIRKADQLFAGCNNKLGNIKCRMAAAALYGIQHIANYGLPQELRGDTDYRSRKILAAFEIYKLLKTIGEGEFIANPDTSMLKASCKEFFNSAIEQLHNYRRTAVPETVRELLNIEKLRLGDLTAAFEEAIQLQDDLRLPQKDSKCNVM